MPKCFTEESDEGNFDKENTNNDNSSNSENTNEETKMKKSWFVCFKQICFCILNINRPYICKSEGFTFPNKHSFIL